MALSFGRDINERFIMNSEVLRRDIKSKAPMTVGPLIDRAQAGDVTPKMVMTYLSSLHFLVAYTPEALSNARKRALELQEPALANYFAHKLEEEAGHDAWARSDLEQLRERFQIAIPEPTESIRRVVELQREIIERCPRDYLAYILAVEYLTVLAGPALVQMLETRCGMPASAFSVVAHQVELVQEHVAEGLLEIDELVQTEDEMKALQETADLVLKHLQAFLTEIGGMRH
jgi:pyrroloquinoline quinone (PQQ) biosynthesis protein C